MQQLNQYETDFLHQEIFEREIYLQHGVHLPPDATVVDVGANIGMFTLWVKQRCPGAKVYSFEPSPEAYRCLIMNCEPLTPEVKVFNHAVAGGPGSGKFCYYPGYSAISGLYANLERDQNIIMAGMRNGYPSASSEEIQRVVSSRFREKRFFEVKTLSIAQVIHDQKIERVHLLKIDAEHAELEILRGLRPENWGKIDQLVVEVHSPEHQAEAQRLLRSQGYRVFTEPDEALGGCGISTTYALRSSP